MKHLVLLAIAIDAGADVDVGVCADVDDDEALDARRAHLKTVVQALNFHFLVVSFGIAFVHSSTLQLMLV